VFFDGNSKLYDKSDARLRLRADRRHEGDAFEEEHDAKGLVARKEVVKPLYDWFTPDVVIKAEYYEVEEVDAKLVILTHEASARNSGIWDDELSRGDLDDYPQAGLDQQDLEPQAPPGPQIPDERRAGAEGSGLYRRHLHPDCPGLRQAVLCRQHGAVPGLCLQAHGQPAGL
jgi:hypothetical protein